MRFIVKTSVGYIGFAETLAPQGIQRFCPNCSAFHLDPLQALVHKGFSLPDHSNCGF
jgi:hypothetical protein